MTKAKPQPKKTEKKAAKGALSTAQLDKAVGGAYRQSNVWGKSGG